MIQFGSRYSGSYGFRPTLISNSSDAFDAILLKHISERNILTHTSNEMLRDVVDRNCNLYWIWDRSKVTEIPFFTIREIATTNEQATCYANLLFTKSNQEVLAKLWSRSDTYPLSIIEFSPLASSFISPFSDSIFSSLVNTPISRSESNFHNSNSLFNVNRNPCFDKSFFYSTYKETQQNYFSISVMELCYYRVQNISSGLMVSLKLENDDTYKLSHVVFRTQGHVFIPAIMRKYNSFKLIIHYGEHQLDEVEFRISIVQSSNRRHSLSFLNSLQNVPNYDDYIIQRDSFQPSLIPNYVLHPLYPGITLRFILKKQILNGTIILYNEHTSKSFSSKISGNRVCITIPDNLAEPGNTMRMYLYSSENSFIPLDEIYFMFETPFPERESSFTIPPLRNSDSGLIQNTTFGTLPNFELNQQQQQQQLQHKKSLFPSSSSQFPQHRTQTLYPINRIDSSRLRSPHRSSSLPGSIYETPILNDIFFGKVEIALQIRHKRRGQWFETNVSPQKIGKMRRCQLKCINIMKDATIKIESSDGEGIKLSRQGKSSTDGLPNIDFKIVANVNTELFFYIVPINGASVNNITVKISIEINNNIVGIHQWDWIVANHKYESSTEGISQSKINHHSIVYSLFGDENGKNITTSCLESESLIIDSLYLLRNDLRVKPPRSY